MDNKIKLVIADIDGTLLNSQLILTQRTRNALRALKKRGIPFCIAAVGPLPHC